MRTSLMTCLIALTPLTGAADGHADALARFEAGTIAMTENLLDFYESRVPELADVRPDMSWDDDFRTAGQCVLDGLHSHGGDAAIAAHLAALEDFGSAEITTFTELTTKMPDVLADPKTLEFSSTCGMIGLGTERMEASGLNAAFQADGVMERVLAPAQ